MKALSHKKPIYWYFVPVDEVSPELTGYYDPALFATWNGESCYLIKTNEELQEPAILIKNKAEAKYAFDFPEDQE